MLAVSACGSSVSSGGGSSGSDDSINITYSAITAAYANLYAEQEAGIFAKHGLHMTFNALQGSSELDAALVSGHSQIGLGPAVNSASAILKGIPLDVAKKFYAAEVDGLAYLRSHPAQTKTAIVEYTGIKDQQQVDAAYQFFLGVRAKTPAFDGTDMAAMRSAFAEAAAKAKKPAPSAADIQKNYVVRFDTSP